MLVPVIKGLINGLSEGLPEMVDSPLSYQILLFSLCVGIYQIN